MSVGLSTLSQMQVAFFEGLSQFTSQFALLLVEELVERHSHAIVIGRIRDIRLGSDSAALIYWRGDYERLGWMAEEAATALGLRAN